MELTTARALVIGIGNVLAGDDGVGPAVAAALADGAGLPPGTEVLDGGTLGLGLLAWLADRDVLVLVDAAELRASPGAVQVLDGEELAAGPGAVADLLASAAQTSVLPRLVALVAVQPTTVEPGASMSAAVAGALPTAIAAVRKAVRQLAGQVQSQSPRD